MEKIKNQRKGDGTMNIEEDFKNLPNLATKRQKY